MNTCIEMAFERLARTPCNGVFEHPDTKTLVLQLILSELPLFWHPLGFVQYEANELLSMPSPYDRARVHIFDKEYRRQATSPSLAHSHNWNLKSAVVFGEMENVIYDLRDDEEGGCCLYEVSYKSRITAKFKEKSWRGNLAESSRIRYSLGRVYCQKAAVMHSSSICSDMAITLVLGQSTRLEAAMVCKAGELSEYTHVRNELSRRDRLDLVGRLERLGF